MAYLGCIEDNLLTWFGRCFIFNLTKSLLFRKGKNMNQSQNTVEKLKFSTDRAALQAIEKAWKSGDSSYFLKVLREAADKRGAA